MSQMGLQHDHHHHRGQDSGYSDSNASWIDHGSAYHTPQHQSSIHEYNAFSFNPMPMEPMYSHGMPPPRTTHQQLQPLLMPQWPSMLTSQSTYVPPSFPTAPVPIPALSASAPMGGLHQRPGHTSSTPRKTLTDADRKRMCLYHEEHPTTKQTEIGAMFGVERSTVSKVLRNKEKWLYQEDGSRSPIKRSKGKFPDIERALSNWARSQQKNGLPLTDALIEEKARFFATSTGNTEYSVKATSRSWLEKFKQKNNLLGAKSRKSSVRSLDSESDDPSAAQTPSGVSPSSPKGIGSPEPAAVSAVKSEEDPKRESPDSFIDFTRSHRPLHSESNASLNSAFTEGGHSSFSAGPTSPTSPFFTPDSTIGPSPFGQPGTSGFQRPRSQTFPMLGIEQYISPPSSSDDLTPKFIQSTALDSPLSEMPNPLGVVDESMQLPPPASASMQPPQLPHSSPGAPGSIAPPTTSISTSLPPSLHHAHSSPITPSSSISTPVSPSQEDARRALELVMNFFQQQPNGFVEPQEYMTIGKLMEKLRLQQGPQSSRAGPGESMPGGMHRIPSGEFNRKAE